MNFQMYIWTKPDEKNQDMIHILRLEKICNFVTKIIHIYIKIFCKKTR